MFARYVSRGEAGNGRALRRCRIGARSGGSQGGWVLTVMYRSAMIRLLVGLASPVCAQAASPDAPEALGGPSAPPRWVAMVGGSVTLVSDQKDQPSTNISLTRILPKGYVSLSVSISDMATRASTAGLLPDRIEIASIGAGRYMGMFLVEGHFAGGRGSYGNNSGSLSGATFDSSADGLGVGASVSAMIKAGSTLVLTPRLGIDYSSTRIAGKAVVPNGQPSLTELKSDGFTYSAGGDIQLRFGASHRHSVTITATAMRTSNVTDFIHRTTRVDFDHKNDDVDLFANLAATLNIGLSPKMGLGLGLSQSGFTSGTETTVISTLLRLAF